MLLAARIISFLTSPIFVIAPVPFLLIHYETSDSIYALKWTIFSMGFLLIIGLFMIYSVRHKIFSDLDISKRTERPLLFLVLAVVSTLYLLSLYLLKGPSVLFIGMLGVLTALFTIAAINTRIKASIHVATITSVILVIGVLYDLPVYFVAIIPLIAWARITAKRHTMQETVMGAIIGSLLILVMYIIVRYTLKIP